MRGEVSVFDGATGMGAITGDDGRRYLFTAPDVRATAALRPGDKVDFVSGDDDQAREIYPMNAGSTAWAPATQVRFDLGRVIQQTVAALRRDAAVFFGAAFVLVGLPGVLTAYGQASIAQSGSPVGLAAMAFGTILNLVGMYLLQGMVVKAAVSGFLGRAVRPSEAFNAGVRAFLPLLGLAIVSGLAIGLGFILFIVPGAILAVLWSVAAPSLVAERRGVFASLQRSRDLTRGYRWQVFGLLVVYVLVSWIIGLVVLALSAALTGGFAMSTSSIWVNLITGPLVNILGGVVGSAATASLYYELKTLKEGPGFDQVASIFD